MATQVISGHGAYAMWQPVGAERVPRSNFSRRHRWGGVTPEIYFNKAIDNSRLMKVADPKRAREMTMFVVSAAILCFCTMIYVWQHLSSIEYGYKIEAQKIERDALLEQNRSLRLEDASLRDPERIDALARRMGMQSPQPGQVQRMERDTKDAGPVLASVSAVTTLSATP